MFRLGCGIHKPEPTGEYCYVIERRVDDSYSYDGYSNQTLAVYSSLMDALKFIAVEIMAFNVESEPHPQNRGKLIHTPFKSDLSYLKEIMLTRWRGHVSEDVKIDLRMIN